MSVTSEPENNCVHIVKKSKRSNSWVQIMLALALFSLAGSIMFTACNQRPVHGDYHKVLKEFRDLKAQFLALRAENLNLERAISQRPAPVQTNGEHKILLSKIYQLEQLVGDLLNRKQERSNLEGLLMGNMDQNGKIRSIDHMSGGVISQLKSQFQQELKQQLDQQLKASQERIDIALADLKRNAGEQQRRLSRIDDQTREHFGLIESLQEQVKNNNQAERKQEKNIDLSENNIKTKSVNNEKQVNSHQPIVEKKKEVPVETGESTYRFKRQPVKEAEPTKKQQSLNDMYKESFEQQYNELLKKQELEQQRQRELYNQQQREIYNQQQQQRQHRGSHGHHGRHGHHHRHNNRNFPGFEL